MTMSMQHLVQTYLNERRGLGFSLIISGSQLLAFARFADRSGHRGPLTRQLVTSWARDEAKRATPLTWARRLEIVRRFAKHRVRIEPGTWVPEADTFGRSRRRLAPHLYTDREIVDLLAAGDRLSPKGKLRPATYRALFGLIAATGLRVSEALRLGCADVDLDAGMLTVRQTKFAKSRLVPLHPTSVHALRQYLRELKLPARLRDRHTALRHQLHRLDLELAAGVRFFICCPKLHGHDLIFVSTKPAAGHGGPAGAGRHKDLSNECRDPPSGLISIHHSGTMNRPLIRYKL